MDTVVETARRLSAGVPGAIARRVHPNLVSISDIAQRVGVSREAVRKWVNGGRVPFPVPFDTIGTDQRVWRWVEVVEWLLQAKGIDMDEDLPGIADIDHIDTCLASSWTTSWPPAALRALGGGGDDVEADLAAIEASFGGLLEAAPAGRGRDGRALHLDDVWGLA